MPTQYLVWKSFEKFIDANIGSDQVGVLIAWNGEGCNLRWLYKVTQAPYSSLNFPCKVKYFRDPLAVLGHIHGVSFTKNIVS